MGEAEYVVEMSEARWRGLVEPEEELTARARSELERLARELPAHRREGASVRTMLLAGGLSLLVSINHATRTVALLEVKRQGT